MIEEKSKLVEYIFSKATYIKKKPTCILYYITTGKWVDDRNCVGRIEIAKDDLMDMNILKKSDTYLLERICFKNYIEIPLML